MNQLARVKKAAAKIAVLAAIAGAFGCNRADLATDNESVIANQAIPASISCSDYETGVLFLNLHHDEVTSVEAGQVVLPEVEGRLCALVHEGGRNVTFESGGKPYTFDPNRIFTDAGARASLERLSGADTAQPAVPAAVIEEVRRFARGLLRDAGLDRARVVVALHNNTEANYSASSYLPGAEFAVDAELVHLAPGTDPDDFFFVTEQVLFDRLRADGFNVVLQDNDAMTDDGSLSVYAAREGIRYVNVEAQHGHREEQERMLRALVQVLASADGP